MDLNAWLLCPLDSEWVQTMGSPAGVRREEESEAKTVFPCLASLAITSSFSVPSSEDTL